MWGGYAMSARRGGIPGPESRTGLVRPTMTEAEFERRQVAEAVEPPSVIEPEPIVRVVSPSRTRTGRTKPPAKPRRVQRMFAIEEDLDKKLWLYAIHVGKDRSEVVNDLLRPLVTSMVLYDSRDRRTGRVSEPGPEEQGGADDR
jgi:hypothetical protein